MISSLRGRLNRAEKDYVEIEVNGVGYEVKLKGDGLKLKVGEDILLPVQMIVSENDMSLYGFENEDSKIIFNLLRSVGGVGPKTAAGIVWQSQSEAIIKAIGNADVGFFEKIKGIGKKTAQRIIVDLKSKIGGLGELDLTDEF